LIAYVSFHSWCRPSIRRWWWVSVTALVPIAAGTAVAHVVLTVGVALHSRRTGRDPGYWLLATLLGGFIGVAGYLWTR